jgi:hypothetical protein
MQQSICQIRNTVMTCTIVKIPQQGRYRVWNTQEIQIFMADRAVQTYKRKDSFQRAGAYDLRGTNSRRTPKGSFPF